MKSRTCRQVKREEAAVRGSQMGAALIPPFWAPIFKEKSVEFMLVNNGQSQPPWNEEREEKRGKLEKKNGMRMRGRPMGGKSCRLWLSCGSC